MDLTWPVICSYLTKDFGIPQVLCGNATCADRESERGRRIGRWNARRAAGEIFAKKGFLIIFSMHLSIKFFLKHELYILIDTDCFSVSSQITVVDSRDIYLYISHYINLIPHITQDTHMYSQVNTNFFWRGIYICKKWLAWTCEQVVDYLRPEVARSAGGGSWAAGVRGRSPRKFLGFSRARKSQDAIW